MRTLVLTGALVFLSATFTCARAQILGSNGNAALAQATRVCMESAKAQPKTLNSVVDTRCSLVAFEVCMNKATGVISQSQDAKRQCAMLKEIAGPNTCSQPCSETTALPVGGAGVIGKYTGLTAAAVACYNKATGGKIDIEEKTSGQCWVNTALECLQNASALPTVNAEILRDRRTACESHFSNFPGNSCTACVNGRLRVDYEEQKKHDVFRGDVIPKK